MTATEYYAMLLSRDVREPSPPQTWEYRIAVYALGHGTTPDAVTAMDGMAEKTGDLPPLEDMRCEPGGIVRVVFFGTPVFIWHPALVSERGRTCPRCKRDFAAGENVKRGNGGYIYHVVCGSAVIDAATDAEHEKKKKTGWHGHHGRVIKKGGGLG